MGTHNIIPEFECFDTGIVRSVGMFKANAMFEGRAASVICNGGRQRHAGQSRSASDP